jgi:predicted HD phosphohydrolase
MDMNRSASDTTVDEIVEACLSMTGLPYDGEPVDQLEHALQCAALAAEERPQDDEYVVACLLHDIARAPAVAGVQYDEPDEHHGESGARWLTPRVGARVAWLAEQHVDAKRYLVATDSAYRGRLSEVSLKTLEQQGGPMSEAEITHFEQHPDWREAVALRRLDDQGKVPGLPVADIDSYRGVLGRVVDAHGA